MINIGYDDGQTFFDQIRSEGIDGEVLNGQVLLLPEEDEFGKLP